MVNDELTNFVFPFYSSNVKNILPIENVSVGYWLRMVKYSNKDLKLIFEKLHKITDPVEKRQLKEHLYFCTPAIQTDGKGRGYANILNFTGIMPLDFDKIENAPEFRDYLIETYEFIFAAWVSPSGKGVRAFVWIPVANSPDEFKEYFWGLANEIMIKYKGFDRAPQNCVLPLFLSYDPDLKYKNARYQWTGKGQSPIHTVKEPIINFNYKPSNDREKLFIQKLIESHIDRIVDNGHTQVRATAFLLGGYVGANRFDYNEAKTLIEGLISRNSYLSKGTKGYLKTANEMLNSGTNKPCYE